VKHDVPKAGRSGFTVVEGRQVHYLEWGPSGAAPLVCLHGGGQTAYMWEELGDALRSRYHVLAPDLPAHGDSDPVDDPDLSRHALAATIPALLDEFGIDRAVFIGASLAMVLVDIGHRLEDEGVNRIIEFMTRHESFASLDEAATEVAAYLPNRSNVKPDNLRRNLRQRPDGRWEWKHSLGRRMRSADFKLGGWRELTAGLDEEMPHLTCPVLVLRGAKSDVLSDEGAEEVAALIPDARLATITSAGHHAAGDNPQSTVDVVSGFLIELGW
jgi:pimeloyl-ACP methyl ester carboxylesterase